MGMHVRSLKLRNYRNYYELELALQPGINIFLGPNAQGKTNVIEAIYYASLGHSHRTHLDAELIRSKRATSLKTADHIIDRYEPVVFDIVEKISGDHPVLLNRAPTLHPATKPTAVADLRLVRMIRIRTIIDCIIVHNHDNPFSLCIR